MKKKTLLIFLLILAMFGINLVGCTSEATPTTQPTDSDTVADDTPKKYFTLSCDDGITQDARIIEILNKYDANWSLF